MTKCSGIGMPLLSKMRLAWSRALRMQVTSVEESFGTSGSRMKYASTTLVYMGLHCQCRSVGWIGIWNHILFLWCCKHIKIINIPNLKSYDLMLIIQGTPHMIQPRRWIWGRHAPASDLGFTVFIRGYRVFAWSRPSRSSFKILMLFPSPETACSLSTFNRDWVWRYIRMFLMWTAWLFSSCCLSCSKHVFFKRSVNSLHWVHLSWHGMPPKNKY